MKYFVPENIRYLGIHWNHYPSKDIVREGIRQAALALVGSDTLSNSFPHPEELLRKIPKPNVKQDYVVILAVKIDQGVMPLPFVTGVYCRSTGASGELVIQEVPTP